MSGADITSYIPIDPAPNPDPHPDPGPANS